MITTYTKYFLCGGQMSYTWQIVIAAAHTMCGNFNTTYGKREVDKQSIKSYGASCKCLRKILRKSVVHIFVFDIFYCPTICKLCCLIL